VTNTVPKNCLDQIVLFATRSHDPTEGKGKEEGDISLTIKDLSGLDAGFLRYGRGNPRWGL